MVKTCKNVADHLFIIQMLPGRRHLIDEALHLGIVCSIGGLPLAHAGKLGVKVNNVRLQLRREHAKNGTPHADGRRLRGHLAKNLLGHRVEQEAKQQLALRIPRRIGRIVFALHGLVRELSLDGRTRRRSCTIEKAR
jgi:hypothetical protein